MREGLRPAYQSDFLALHSDVMLNRDMRIRKAKKIIAVLEDYFHCPVFSSYALLDAGCSAGLITSFLGTQFKKVVGIDFDQGACRTAASQPHEPNVHFAVSDAMNLPFPEGAFDVVICAHLYEHVPDPQRLLDEVHRVLKNTGICYFAAANRLRVLEPHHKLPFLSLLPRPLAHLYLKLARRKSFYPEKMLMPWRLREITRRFEVVDYTRKVISEPGKYFVDELIPAGIKGRMSAFLLRRITWLSPTFIWILRKK